MPTNDGRIKGQGWSPARERGWLRVFGGEEEVTPCKDDSDQETSSGSITSDDSSSQK